MLLLFYYQISRIFWISNCIFICKCLVANMFISLMLFLRCMLLFSHYFQDMSNIVQPLLVNVSLLPRLIYWMNLFFYSHHFSKQMNESPPRWAILTHFLCCYCTVPAHSPAQEAEEGQVCVSWAS